MCVIIVKNTNLLLLTLFAVGLYYVYQIYQNTLLIYNIVVGVFIMQVMVETRYQLNHS